MESIENTENFKALAIKLKVGAEMMLEKDAEMNSRVSIMNNASNENTKPKKLVRKVVGMTFGQAVMNIASSENIGPEKLLKILGEMSLTAKKWAEIYKTFEDEPIRNLCTETIAKIIRNNWDSEKYGFFDWTNIAGHIDIPEITKLIDIKLHEIKERELSIPPEERANKLKESVFSEFKRQEQNFAELQEKHDNGEPV